MLGQNNNKQKMNLPIAPVVAEGGVIAIRFATLPPNPKDKKPSEKLGFQLLFGVKGTDGEEVHKWSDRWYTASNIDYNLNKFNVHCNGDERIINAIEETTDDPASFAKFFDLPLYINFVLDAKKHKYPQVKQIGILEKEHADGVKNPYTYDLEALPPWPTANYFGQSITITSTIVRLPDGTAHQVEQSEYKDVQQG